MKLEDGLVGEALVVDCSAIADALIGSASDEVMDLIGTRTLVAPALIDYELMSVMRRLVTRDALAASDATEALELFGDMQIERHSAGPLRHRMWSMRQEITSYDSAYVALAEALGVPLLTADLRLARTARRWCEVIEA